jgi:hypothetical protein
MIAKRAIAAAEAWRAAQAEGRVETEGGDRRSLAQSGRVMLIRNPRAHFAKLLASNERLHVRESPWRLPGRSRGRLIHGRGDWDCSCLARA